ncbi:RNA-guided endonuclease InsQ/TnpB family protein [Paeniglutamicibacter sp. NPDC091659]|uniref:RNA-guided endonuclease InsQ/TnpB family protein n=1 Tax=Paeniglutamicibacter sp. NPDC091659 TaxID=3364389 RepID=UPI0037FA50AF
MGIEGLGRTRLAKSIYDAGWGLLIRLIEEKADEAGRFIVRADRMFPSTRTCNVCGLVGEKKPLHIRSWTCSCGEVHDRDVNAAMNLRNVAAGQAETLNDCGGHVSPAVMPATTRDAVATHDAA